ncbi:hypothetical protein N0V93_004226 [Gnomoniopsis smithogilvyi]|uniref:Uncharacterized protein n=1 Tax=Gnomoniopsis smithogilvyi TaxID=1191159 RepID=A0A9W8YUD6_9PEZI|nr:hypothetical protein N0V93_004226 [Gnomoniopsis smithogilvyi]
MMKPIVGVMVLSIMALATVPTPLPSFTNTSSPLFGTHTSNVIEPIVQRQVGTNAFGSSCSDEGEWFCMANSFQRCASGEWSVVQSCAPGTQCEPLGITHNASQPAFGIYDGNSNGGTTMTDPSTTNFGIEPVTKTTTIDVMLHLDQNRYFYYKLEIKLTRQLAFAEYKNVEGLEVVSVDESI